MTEQQKMLDGQLYDASDKQLVLLRKNIRHLTHEYSSTQDKEVHQKLIAQMFGSVGQNCNIEPPLRLDYGKNTFLGDNFYANFNLTILDCATVKIGDNCMFGANVTIATPMHPLLACDRNIRKRADGTYFDFEYAKSVTIGNNVWLACNVVVNGGVTIGDDCVIGSGSVVTRDIPSGVIAAGVPARVIRKLTDNDKMQLPTDNE